jgi:hypothetical protein
MVIAAKRAVDLSRRVSIFDSGDLPNDPACLDALDVLVLSSDRLGSDPGGAALVREWVLGGGHLWIMVDEVQQATISALLGDAFSSTIVDRVGLTQLKIEEVHGGVPYGEDVTLDFEEPVAFARVLPEGVEVTHTVDGWPAAFWQPFGTGRVFYTTLGAPAWIRPISPDDPPPQSQEDFASFVGRGSLQHFAELSLSGREPQPLDVAAVKPFLAKQIGYRILGREVVAALLAAFCSIVCLAGLWFLRTGHLERLLWAAPAAAAVTSALFLGVAVSARRSVPPTVAMLQRVMLEPGVGTGHARGLASLYSPEAFGAGMGASGGGIFFPDMTAMAGQRRRMVWTEEGTWHWEDLKLPPGVRVAPLTHVVHLDETVECRARFGPAGLQGRFESSFKNLGDAVISLPGLPLAAANIREDGTFTSAGGDVLAPGEFTTDTWLTDIQRRRKPIYQQLFSGQSTETESGRTTLFVWADSIDSGFTFPHEKRLGSALLSIPVRMERPSPGARVTVPASFLEYRGIVGPDGHKPTVYSHSLKQWVETKDAVTEWLRFQIPAAVLPIELSRATLALDVRAPSRAVEILGLVDGSPVVVRSFSHPIGTYGITLDRPELLRLDDQGGLVVAIRVGEDESTETGDVMTKARWRVDSLQMENEGTVQGE